MGMLRRPGMAFLPLTIALGAGAALAGAACGDDGGGGGAGGSGGAGGAGGSGGGEGARGLAIVHEPDQTIVADGLRAFSDAELVQGVLPPDALRHLYITWTTNLATYYAYYTDRDAYWAAFNERYGTVPSPFEDATYPAGFGLAGNGKVGIDCLLCHASRFEGTTIIGASNNRLDLRALVEDLQRLPEAVAALKARDDLPAQYEALVDSLPDDQVPEPYASLEVPTGAAGLNDGFGLGLLTGTYHADPPAGLETFMGFEDAPPWWTMKHKERLYTDGSAPADGIYTMMSTLLAFGLTLPELARYLPTFRAIQSFAWATPAPRWQDYDLPAIDEELAEEGARVFASRCASCHGAYTGDVFPNVLATPADIGTDPLRAESFGETEADFFNSFIPEPDARMEPTGSYLAPALTGVFASPPYLHNGSVPTLRALLLVPEERPTYWRRDGESFDATAVGMAFEEVDEPGDPETVEGRKIVDTTREGLDGGGHEISLTDEEAAAVLEFLKTL